MKVFIITYYDGNEFKTEEQRVGPDTELVDLVFPVDREDVNSIVELYRPVQPEHKVWLNVDGNFVEQHYDR